MSESAGNVARLTLNKVHVSHFLIDVLVAYQFPHQLHTLTHTHTDTHTHDEKKTNDLNHSRTLGPTCLFSLLVFIPFPGLYPFIYY